MIKKALAKNKREAAVITANLDGKRKGLSQKQVKKAFDYLEALEVASILTRRPSTILKLRKAAKVKAAALKKKAKKVN